jgi:hypothetical protein
MRLSGPKVEVVLSKDSSIPDTSGIALTLTTGRRQIISDHVWCSG